MENISHDLCNQLLMFPMHLICSEEEARMKIYSVSTRCYYAFGALVSEEISYKIKGNFCFWVSA